MALSGGAVLGAAHVGVLQALAERSVGVDRVSGTSIGAMVAIFHAFGVDHVRIREIAERLRWLDISRPNFSRLGLLTNARVEKLVERELGDVDLSEARIPVSVMTTDITTGEAVVIEEGPAGLAARASACLPGIFEPVEWEGRLLVDGGLVENVPVSPLKAAGCDYIIAVDVNRRRGYRTPGDLIDVAANAVSIAIDRNSRHLTEDVELLLEPELKGYSGRDTGQTRELIERGYECAREALGRRAAKALVQRRATRRKWWRRFL